MGLVVMAVAALGPNGAAGAQRTALHVLPQSLGNVTFAGPGPVVEFEMGAEMSTHRGTWPFLRGDSTRTGGEAAELDLCLLSTALCPGLRRICKRKLDSKLFCLAAGRRRRREGPRGVTHHQLIKGRNANPGEGGAPRQRCAPGHLAGCSAAVDVRCAVPQSQVQIRTFYYF